MKATARARNNSSPSHLLLGRTAARRPARGPAMGFAPQAAHTPERPRLLTYDGDGHLLTVAPTGAGKGRGAIIPNLLHYPGPVICIDPKGENYQVTARRRREMGQQVVVLDPFGAATDRGDRLNPFDLFYLPGSQVDSDAEMLAELITGGETVLGKDPFWDLTAGGLLTGLIGYTAEHADPDKQNLGGMLDLLHHDDVDYNLAVILDSKKFQTPMIRQEIAAYLSHEGERCRPSVRSTAQAKVKALGSAAVRRATGDSTFDLHALVRGDPVSVYLVLPPEKIYSHRAVLRLWLGVLLTAVMRRPQLPPLRTLFILDECAQLGSLPMLRTALTLLRGFGLQVWTFWQDLSQLKLLYPHDWPTIVNNSAVVQAFGVTNHLMAAECGALLGVPARELMRLSPAEQLLQLPRRRAVTGRRLDYLRDRRFASHFDANRRFPLTR
jgi:type IV secretion system protein VirD4